MNQKQIEDLIREERRRYAREWRAKNRDKVRETNKRYWERKALSRLESAKVKSAEVG